MYRTTSKIDEGVDVMGRIKTMPIKRATHKIFKEYGNNFTEDFSANKKIVARVINTKSKKIINTITGYVTRLVSMKDHLKPTY